MKFKLLFMLLALFAISSCSSINDSISGESDTDNFKDATKEEVIEACNKARNNYINGNENISLIYKIDYDLNGIDKSYEEKKTCYLKESKEFFLVEQNPYETYNLYTNIENGDTYEYSLRNNKLECNIYNKESLNYLALKEELNILYDNYYLNFSTNISRYYDPNFFLNNPQETCPIETQEYKKLNETYLITKNIVYNAPNGKNYNYKTSLLLNDYKYKSFSISSVQPYYNKETSDDILNYAMKIDFNYEANESLFGLRKLKDMDCDQKFKFKTSVGVKLINEYIEEPLINFKVPQFYIERDENGKFELPKYLTNNDLIIKFYYDIDMLYEVDLNKLYPNCLNEIYSYIGTSNKDPIVIEFFHADSSTVDLTKTTIMEAGDIYNLRSELPSPNKDKYLIDYVVINYSHDVKPIILESDKVYVVDYYFKRVN